MTKHWRGLVTIGLAGALVLGMSGCWSMSGYQLSKVKLRPGPPKVSKSTITVRSHVTSTAAREYFFILTAVGTESGVNVGNGGRFDLKRKWGKKPKPLFPNAAIRDEIISDEGCGQVDLTEFKSPLSEAKIKVLSTRNQFNNKGRRNQQAVSKIHLRQAAPSVVDEPDDVRTTMLLAVGSWRDADEDGVVDASEAFGCGGASVTELLTKFAD